jgi:uncharacterized damage-inducible protein DinB
MLKLFEYNWQVRKDWFDWCDSVDEKELLKKRTGGLGAWAAFSTLCFTLWMSSTAG